MPLKISTSVREKLKSKHQVKVCEIEECFANRDGEFLDDPREKHKSDPKTQWFVSETDHGRKLKVVFLQHEDGTIEIKSTFAPNATELCLYNRHAY